MFNISPNSLEQETAQIAEYLCTHNEEEILNSPGELERMRAVVVRFSEQLTTTYQSTVQTGYARYEEIEEIGQAHTTDLRHLLQQIKGVQKLLQQINSLFIQRAKEVRLAKLFLTQVGFSTEFLNNASQDRILILCKTVEGVAIEQQQLEAFCEKLAIEPSELFEKILLCPENEALIEAPLHLRLTNLDIFHFFLTNLDIFSDDVKQSEYCTERFLKRLSNIKQFNKKELNSLALLMRKLTDPAQRDTLYEFLEDFDSTGTIIYPLLDQPLSEQVAFVLGQCQLRTNRKVPFKYRRNIPTHTIKIICKNEARACQLVEGRNLALLGKFPDVLLEKILEVTAHLPCELVDYRSWLKILLRSFASGSEGQLRIEFLLDHIEAAAELCRFGWSIKTLLLDLTYENMCLLLIHSTYPDAVKSLKDANLYNDWARFPLAVKEIVLEQYLKFRELCANPPAGMDRQYLLECLRQLSLQSIGCFKEFLLYPSFFVQLSDQVAAGAVGQLTPFAFAERLIQRRDDIHDLMEDSSSDR